jgi:hypothetical protein
MGTRVLPSFKCKNSDNNIFWKFLCINAFILWRSQFMGNETQTKIKINWKHILLGNDHLECRVKGRGREKTEKEKESNSRERHQ